MDADGGTFGIQLVTRTDGEQRCWLALNTGKGPLDVSLDAGQPLRELPLEEGLPALLEKTQAGYRRTLQPFEAVLLETTASQAAESKPSVTPRVTVKIGGEAKITPLSANLLRIYNWRMSLIGPDEKVQQTANVLAVPLINQLRDGGFSFVPGVQEYWGTISELQSAEDACPVCHRVPESLRCPRGPGYGARLDRRRLVDPR